MGGNTIALFRDETFPRHDRPASVTRVLFDDGLACHEAGLLHPSPEAIAVKIVGRSSRAWITACGGLTQVLGRVLADEEACRRLELKRVTLPASVVLDTDGGRVPLFIDETSEGPRTWTDMTAFLGELFRDGLEELLLEGFRARKIGKFLVVDGRDLEERHSPEAVANLSSEVRETLVTMQRAFLRSPSGKKSLDFALFDDRPERKGRFRLLFPHNIPEGHIEPACGTGTVAVALALFVSGRLEAESLMDDGSHEIPFESGGGPFLGGPEESRLRMEVRNRRPTKIFFSHDRVRLTVMGDLFLPDGGGES